MTIIAIPDNSTTPIISSVISEATSSQNTINTTPKNSTTIICSNIMDKSRIY